MQATLGLTGLTSNAVALIAPGAFLWLTFVIQAGTGSTGPAMWTGILAALLLCLATAVSYAEISRLYPGTGSSYYYAEQVLLSREKAFKYARLLKFIVGWGSHLYYWVYPGVMVGVTGIFVGYVVGFLYPNLNHPAGSPAFQYHTSSLATYTYEFATKPDGTVIRDASGIPQPQMDNDGKPVVPTTQPPGDRRSIGRSDGHVSRQALSAPRHVAP